MTGLEQQPTIDLGAVVPTSSGNAMAAVAFAAWVIALGLLVVAPALVIAVWSWAL